MTTIKEGESESRVRITRTRLVSSDYGDEVRVYFSCGRRKSWVDLRVKDFSEASLKGAVGEKLAVLFLRDRAKSYVGRSFAIEEVLKETGRKSREDWWFE